MVETLSQQNWKYCAWYIGTINSSNRYRIDFNTDLVPQQDLYFKAKDKVEYYYH